VSCIYDVKYDDGDHEEAVARYRIRRVGEAAPVNANGERVFEVGDLVDARHQGGRTYYAARVGAIGGGNNGVSYDLEYLDGDKEQGVSPDFIEGLYGMSGDAVAAEAVEAANAEEAVDYAMIKEQIRPALPKSVLSLFERHGDKRFVAAALSVSRSLSTVTSSA
jgi:hypothetical protein